MYVIHDVLFLRLTEIINCYMIFSRILLHDMKDAMGFLEGQGLQLLLWAQCDVVLVTPEADGISQGLKVEAFPGRIRNYYV